MSGKEDKLAAARRKLKEFQDKNREPVNKRNVPYDPCDSFKDLTASSPSHSPSSHTSEASCTSSYNEQIPEKYESNTEKKITNISTEKFDTVNGADPSKTNSLIPNQDVSEHSISVVISSEKSGPNDFINEGINGSPSKKIPHEDTESPANHTNGLHSGEEGVTQTGTNAITVIETTDSDETKHEQVNSFLEDTESTAKEIQHNNNNGDSGLVQDSCKNIGGKELKDFFWITLTPEDKPNAPEPEPEQEPEPEPEQEPEPEAKPKSEPESKPQPEDTPGAGLSIAQLIEENNNLTDVLKTTQKLLKYKTGEEEYLSQKVSSLEQKVTDLEKSLCNADSVIRKFKMKSESLEKRRVNDAKILEELKQKYDSKTEEYAELQQKLDLKDKECEDLNERLQESQAHLSLCLIKIQQLYVGRLPASKLTESELLKENASLTEKIEELEKSLREVNREKEQSSQSFHTYTQQYKTQIKSLSSEVRTLTKENLSLMQEIRMLDKNVNDLENEKEELQYAAEHSDVKSLADEITQLKEENRMLEQRLKEKVKDIETLKAENKEKLNEISELFSIVQEIKAENINLMEDRERTNRNEKLLAAMESDKVAAARAVSQNQILKDQVLELEEGFIKLSHEKLQLTDELAHERHLKKEMELRLQELQSSHCSDHDHHRSPVTVTNESSDVIELKKIIRQLEEDKTELLSRLNSIKKKTVKTEEGDVESITYTNEDPELLKLRMQQLEGKLKKTMDEMALLHEEKEKLEHINIQLQCETETIGEYISLYQNQRMLLRRRTQEKDNQLMQLFKDKEELKSKLISLNHLVNHLLAEKGHECQEAAAISKTGDDQGAAAYSEVSTEYSEATAERIQNLISEIQSTNLFKSQAIDFHHCPCCSGRLMNV